MREETWYKMLIVSTILHFFVIGMFSIPIKKASRRIDLSSSYSVNLVGDMGGVFKGQQENGLSGGRDLPVKQGPVTKKERLPAKRKTAPVRKEKEAVSLSKHKIPEKETATKEELSRLEERIREIKKKTNYFDITQAKKTGGSLSGLRPGGSGSGLPVSSGGGGARPLDPVSQKYILDVWEKVKDTWGLPGITSSKQPLETVVTIKIRKDGRIVDINIEKRSGNRIYDESILRALRTVELSPIPASLNTDMIEIGFRFLPGDVS
jgi:TonB family protein